MRHRAEEQPPRSVWDRTREAGTKGVALWDPLCRHHRYPNQLCTGQSPSWQHRRQMWNYHKMPNPARSLPPVHPAGSSLP